MYRNTYIYSEEMQANYRFHTKMVDVCSNYVPSKITNGDGTEREPGNAEMNEKC